MRFRKLDPFRLVVLVPALLLTAALSAFSLAQPEPTAERWTVQVARYPDFRDASAVIDTLNSLGFDAYPAFVMVDEVQHSEVRVGCFLDEESAQETVVRLEAVTESALAVPLTEGFGFRFCLSRELGFRTPESWRVVERSLRGVLFQVTLRNFEGYIEYSDLAWHLLQTETSQETAARDWLGAQTAAAQPSPSPSLGARYFAEGEHVHAELAERRFVLSAGELLWDSPAAAVIRYNGALYSLRLLAP